MENKRKALRLAGYDYAKQGAYFVTICMQGRRCVFGNIADGAMDLSEIGLLAKKCWQDIPEHFAGADIDQYVIMPNHVHGIIWINNVGNADLRSLQNDRTKMLLSKIVHGYKSSVTRCVNKIFSGSLFAWQTSFYDHIIRNEVDLNRVREYIVNNPLQWALDKENPANHPQHRVLRRIG